MTKFLVLGSVGNAGGKQWEEIATVDANSKEQAVRSIGGAGIRVAVPTRSWQPVRLEVETVQRTRLRSATETRADAPQPKESA